MALFDEALDHTDHGADLFRRARAHVRIEHVRLVHDVDELLRELFRHLSSAAPLLVGAVDDLVVHVGEVLRERDLVAARDEPAADHVERDERARVANMNVVVHGGATYIHAHFALVNGLELLFRALCAVVDEHADSFDSHRRTRHRALVTCVHCNGIPETLEHPAQGGQTCHVRPRAERYAVRLTPDALPLTI